MKKYLIPSVLAIVVLVGDSFGQKKNTIELNYGGFEVYNVIADHPKKFNMLGLKYSRNVFDRLNVYAAYYRVPLSGRYFTVEATFEVENIGKLINRVRYNYLDAGVNYAFLRLGNGAFSVDGGISTAFGENNYLKIAVWSDPEPGEPYGHPIFAELTTKHERYIGGVFGLGYAHSFWQNRISIGGKVASRFYSDDFPFQVNYFLSAGYSF